MTFPHHRNVQQTDDPDPGPVDEHPCRQSRSLSRRRDLIRVLDRCGDPSSRPHPNGVWSFARTKRLSPTHRTSYLPETPAGPHGDPFRLSDDRLGFGGGALRSTVRVLDERKATWALAVLY